MGNVYEETSHVSNRGFARETSHDVCKPEENCKGLSNHHSVGAVKTRSMDSQESSIERETHVSNNDDTCCEIIHNNDELENEQRNDTTLKLILSWKENNLKPSWAEVSKYGTEVKNYWNRIDSLEIKENILCRKWESEDGQTITWQIVIPDRLKASVLQQLHDNVTGRHLGVRKTVSKVRHIYFWYSVRKYVEYWCKKCDICDSRKSSPMRPNAPMRQYNVGAPLERIIIDVMGPLPTSTVGNEYLLVIGDYFTKCVHAVPNEKSRGGQSS
jgi:hypothetical protein